MFVRINKIIGDIIEARAFPALLFLAFLLFALLYAFVFDAPDDFPYGSFVIVPEGAPLSVISEQLEGSKIVRSGLSFQWFVRMFAGERGVIAGQYYFEEGETVFGVMSRVLTGDYKLDPVRVLIPEGATVADIATILEAILIDFDTDAFLILAKSEEGYLFPDTYYFLPTDGPRQVITRMKENFIEKISTTAPAIKDFGESVHDVVVMASLLEKEARTMETREVIAGILWKRLKDGMPLQVDAVFPYINGKNTFQLSLEDLQVDHPYNTYTRKGLPPGPIANPGLDAIIAAINPEDTPYYFYLSDKEGMMHYARTFDGHLANKARYLR